MIEVTHTENQQEYDEAVLDTAGHPLQLWGWGELKRAHGWRAYRTLVRDGDTVVGGAQVLVKRLPFPFRRMLYIPRGPWAEQGREADVLEAVVQFCKTNTHATLITAEPDWKKFPALKGWKRSPNRILLARTLTLDLLRSEEELLADMTKKTRQYIRKSGREAIEIKRVTSREHIAECLSIYKDTASRANFALHSDDYYYDCARLLDDNNVIFAAFENGKAISFVWLAITPRTAFELYGGMNDRGQELRANYALKWHTITQCKEWGVELYDMNGLLNDGVSTFKQGFASHEDELCGAYDYPLSPLYIVWAKLLPAAKLLIRAIKR